MTKKTASYSMIIKELLKCIPLCNSINRGYIEIAVTTLCHHLQSANVSHSKQKILLFKIDYVCKFPRGREQDLFQPIVYIEINLETWNTVHISPRTSF